MSDPLLPTDQPPTEPPAPPPTPADPPTPPAPPAPPQTGRVEDLPDWAQNLLKKTRDEAAGYRTRLRETEQQGTERQQLLDKLNQVLGNGGDQPPDPDALVKQLADRDAQLRQLQIGQAVTQAAARHGADPELTAALLAHRGALDEITPGEGDWTQQIDTAVQETVGSTPRLRTAQVATRTGTEGAGGTGQTGQLTRADLDRMSPDQISQALEQGRLTGVLGG